MRRAERVPRQPSSRERLSTWCARMALVLGYDWFAYRQQYAEQKYPTSNTNPVRRLTGDDYVEMMGALNHEFMYGRKRRA